MAIIKVSPETDITLLIASAEVNEGDVLLFEEGIYNQVVLISKNNIRLLARNHHVIFDGFDTLAAAFVLLGTTGVEISGITIRNYLLAGILIIGGSANRIVCNVITTTGIWGIVAAESSNNLIWKNWIRRVWYGISLALFSSGNWVIENKVRNCNADCYDSFFTQSTGNAFIGNEACDSGINCFTIVGANNLVYQNTATDAGFNGIALVLGRDSLAIENKSTRNRNTMNGTANLAFSENAFVADNDMSLNDKLGLYVGGAYNVVQNNKIKCNGDDGLLLGIQSFRNLIFQNKIECNVPADIVNFGTDNDFLRNKTGCDHYWYRDGFDNEETNKIKDAVDYGGQVMDSIRRRAELEQEAIGKLESRLEAVPNNLRNNQMIVVEHLKGELAKLEAILSE